MFSKSNLWKIEKNKSQLFDIDTEIKESININNLQKIIKSKYNKTYTDLKWIEDFNFPCQDLQGHLKKLKKQIRNGFLVTHAQIPNGYGRASFKGFMTMCSLPNEVRQALSIDTTVDYDIKNAQPQILFQICKNSSINKKEYKYQEQYCTNRDKVLEEIGKYYFGKYDNEIYKMIKVLIIRVAYFGGGFKKWYEQCEENGFKLKTKYDSDFIINLKEEIQKITEKYVITNNSDIYSEIIMENTKQYTASLDFYEKNQKLKRSVNIILQKPIKKNSKATIISKFLHHYEEIVIETVLLKLVEDKKMIENRYIYAYDGFQDAEKHDLRYLEKIVKDAINFDLEFVIKGTEDGEKLMEKVEVLLKEDLLGKEHPEEYLKEFNTQYFESLCYDYGMQKDYWELFVCFTQKEGNYWFTNVETIKNPENGRIIEKRETEAYKWCKLMESFGDIASYSTNKKTGQEVREPFIQKWKREGMRKYYKMTFYPENKPHSEMLDNKYFNTFNGYPDFIFGDTLYTEEEDKKYNSVWEGILSNLLGDRESMDIYNMLISYKIKYPSKKKPFGIVIKGQQGEGKNFVLSRIAQAIDKHHYNTTSNVEDVLGKHAMGLFHKLIVNLNEMNLTETKTKTERFKSLVSEYEYTFNPKNAQPFEAIIYALLVLTTNSMCPLILDVITGERRWFIFEGNGRNCNISQDKWTEIYKLTETDKFTQWLYNYYNNMDSDNYDFKKAKYENSKTEAYNNLASLFIPHEMLFLKDWLIDSNFVNYSSGCKVDCFSDDEASEEEGWIKYYDRDEFYQTVEVEIKYLLSDFWNWCKDNRVSSGETKNPKSFKGKLASFNFKNIKHDKDTKTRRTTMKFKPIDLLRQLIEKNVIDDCDVKNWKKLDKKGDYKKEDEKTGLNFLDLV